MILLTIVVSVLLLVLIAVVWLKKAALKGTRTVSEREATYNVLGTDDTEADTEHTTALLNCTITSF